MCRSFESSLEPSLRRVTEPHANLRGPTRVYDVEGGAIFAKNSTFVFFDGFAWTRACGLRPRLWLLIQDGILSERFLSLRFGVCRGGAHFLEALFLEGLIIGILR